MNKADSLKRQIDSLPSSMLPEVERFIKNLRKQTKKAPEPASLLSQLTEYVIEDDLPADLAEQHDHYLYGIVKK
jgi:hypothetical protein